MVVKNLRKGYKTEAGETVVFNDFNAEFADGKVTAIMGGSGIGKTTLLNCVAKLTDYKGEIEFPGNPAYVFPIMTISFAKVKASSTSCVTINTVFCEANNLFITSKILNFSPISSDESGSSRSINSLPLANALASETLFFCPPDNSCGYLLASAVSSVISSAVLTRFLLSSLSANGKTNSS